MTAVAAIIFLLWATWRQSRRPLTGAVPWRNTGATFGLVSRGMHWATATLVLCLTPIGLFTQTLPAASPDRAVFMAVHQTLGVTVLVLIALRIAWLTRSPPQQLPPSLRPWEKTLAHAVHPALYALIIFMPLTGLLLTVVSGGPLELYGWTVPLPATTSREPGALWPTLHNQVLPLLFHVIIAMHVGAVASRLRV